MQARPLSTNPALANELVAKVDAAKKKRLPDVRACAIIDVLERLFDKYDGREFLRSNPKFLDCVTKKVQEYASEPGWEAKFEPYVKIAKNIEKTKNKDTKLF